MDLEKVDKAIEYLQSEHKKWKETMNKLEPNNDSDVIHKVIIASECRKINRDIEVLKLLK